MLTSLCCLYTATFKSMGKVKWGQWSLNTCPAPPSRGWQYAHTSVDTVSGLTTGEMELFTPMDCEVGLQPIDLDVKIHMTPENALWFCTLTSPLMLHPLLISDS